MNSVRLLSRQAFGFRHCTRSYIRKAEFEKLKKTLTNPDKITRDSDANWITGQNAIELGPVPNLKPFPVESLFTVEDLFYAKFHLGHKEGSLDPRMKPFLYGSRLGHLIFDLDITAKYLKEALNFMAHIALRDGVILFVSRHLPTVDLVEQAAKDSGEFAHCRKWRAGLFPNSVMQFGVVTRLPDLIVCPCTRDGAMGPHPVIKEAAKVLIPVVGLVDSDCDPGLVTYPVPGNDDSPSSISLFLDLAKKAIRMGKEERRKMETEKVERIDVAAASV